MHQRANLLTWRDKCDYSRNRPGTTSLRSATPSLLLRSQLFLPVMLVVLNYEVITGRSRYCSFSRLPCHSINSEDDKDVLSLRRRRCGLDERVILSLTHCTLLTNRLMLPGQVILTYHTTAPLVFTGDLLVHADM